MPDGIAWSVVVTARSREQIDGVAAETGGRASEMDVSSRESARRRGVSRIVITGSGSAYLPGATKRRTPRQRRLCAATPRR